MKPLVIVAALKDEIAPLRKKLVVEKAFHKERADFYQGILEGAPIILGATGLGEEATREGLGMLLDLVAVRGVIGVGYAGGLVPDLETASLILATEVCHERTDGKSWQADPLLQQQCRVVLEQKKQRFHEGRIVTVMKALISPEQKEEAASKFNAIAVDMESAALAELCSERDVPFLVLRSILDPLKMSVPDPNQFLDRSHRISKRRIFSYVADSPQNVWELPRLGSHAHKARHELTTVLPKIAAAILSEKSV